MKLPSGRADGLKGSEMQTFAYDRMHGYTIHGWGAEWGEDRLQELALCLFLRCEQLATASKRLTIHRSANVLTLCLKRFDAFSGRKINKICIQVHGAFVCSEGDLL